MTAPNRTRASAPIDTSPQFVAVSTTYRRVIDPRSPSTVGNLMHPLSSRGCEASARRPTSCSNPTPSRTCFLIAEPRWYPRTEPYACSAFPGDIRHDRSAGLVNARSVVARAAAQATRRLVPMANCEACSWAPSPQTASAATMPPAIATKPAWARITLRTRMRCQPRARSTASSG